MFSAFLLIAVLCACKKDEKMVIFEQGTSPVLSSSITSVIPLSYLTADDEAINLSWTNPDYTLNTGVSSYDVSYQIEIDTAGANFTNPNEKIIAVSKDLSISISQSDFNDYMLNQLQLAPSISHNLEIRVASFLIGNTGLLYSNVLKLTATPYTIPPKIAPPVSGTLFIVGSAVAGGWDNPISTTHIPTQQFTQVSNTLYQIPSIALVGGGEYKFIAVNGSWDNQWSIKTADDPSEINGGDMVFNGANILAPPISGNYKIEVDFQRGKFTVTAL